MAGKGGKGLLAGKTTVANKDKDKDKGKKTPVSRSSHAEIQAKACSSASISQLKNLNRRTVDVLAAILYFHYSLSYVLTGHLAEIRGNLLALPQIATLRHDELSRETLLNLLLHNYLHYNLYDQAEKLRSKAPRFEAHSNQQFCRYLFYLGNIRTIQLDYTDAKETLLQAARKAPIAALGFREDYLYAERNGESFEALF